MEEDFEAQLQKLDEKIVELHKEEEKLVYTCSKCGSTNLMHVPKSGGKVYFREIKSYYCRDCKFEGVPILKKLKETRKKKCSSCRSGFL